MTFTFTFLANTSNIDLSIAYKDMQGKFAINSRDNCFPATVGDFEIDKRVYYCLNKNFKIKLFNYSSYVIATAILILFSAVFTYNGLANYTYTADQYSIPALVIIMIQDVFITLFMIYLGLNNQQLFHLYFTPALWYFIIFAILDFRLLMLIWKLRNERELANLDVRYTHIESSSTKQSIVVKYQSIC